MDWLKYIVGNIVFMSAAVLLIRMMLSGFRKDIKSDLKEAVTGLQKEDEKIWDRVNGHGHKGLESNGNKVTV